MTWVYDDGGRVEAGYKGHAGDCVCRAVAIATGLPYERVYREINTRAAKERHRCGGKRSSARTGVHTNRTWFKRWLRGLGWVWRPTMQIGTGCTVHLLAEELPPGRLIVAVSQHLVAVIDGVIHDTDDPSRDGRRCVYGYWYKPHAKRA